MADLNSQPKSPWQMLLDQKDSPWLDPSLTTYRNAGSSGWVNTGLPVRNPNMSNPSDQRNPSSDPNDVLASLNLPQQNQGSSILNSFLSPLAQGQRMQRGGMIKIPTSISSLTPQSVYDQQKSRVADFDPLSSEKSGLEEQQRLLEQFKNKKRDIDFSAILPLVDSVSGLNLASTYKAPMSEEDKSAITQQLQGGITKGFGDYASRANQFIKNQDDSKLAGLQLKALIAGSNPKADYKEAEYVDKNLKDINDQLDAYKGRAGNFGEMAKVKYAANRILKTVEDNQGNIKNLSNPIIEDVAIATGSLLSGGGKPTEEQVKALLPKGYEVSITGIKDFLTNDANPAHQQKFLQRLAEIARTQNDVASSAMSDVMASRMYGTHQRFRSMYPNEYNTALNSRGLQYTNGKLGFLSPQQLDALYGKDYSPKPNSQGQSPSAVPNALSSKDQQAIDWASRPENANRPEAMAIKKLHGVK